jgi:hypothetical protein
MSAKSFIGEIETTTRRFYAEVMRGEVNDANVRGFLRAASQIEDIWNQADERMTILIAQGTPVWSVYAQLRYALAFLRAARGYQVFVQELLAADAASDPSTAGYLPRVTYDQANALCHQIQPTLQRAVTALNEPAYVPDMALPLTLGPRIEVEGQVCPLPHLQGMIAAAREMREWAAGLLAQYGNTLAHAQDVPDKIQAHVQRLHSQLAQADAQLRFGVDLVGQVSQGQATPELHEEAEKSLWSALQRFFLLNQVIAAPELFQAGTTNARYSSPTTGYKSYRDQRIRPEDLWRLAAPSARSELYGTPFGRREMSELCSKMHQTLPAEAQRYLDETEAALGRGDIALIAAMANCPFEPLYRTNRPITITEVQISAGHEFHWNFHQNRLEASQRFKRSQEWEECEE